MSMICEKKLKTVFMVRQRCPSPHGMRFIIGIQSGCLPFPTGDRLFENASDRAAFVAIIGNPIQSLTSSEGVIFFVFTIVT